ncbi:hypothetical protein F4811DRAFT_388251 [Daldinia bambusicola]|nr:hypothetical protein F4811DRAFT_388251 [Daldinia bambusicola]
MPQGSSPDCDDSSDPIKHVAVKAEWNTIPCELQAMIIDSMAPQDFRKAWFTCRLVSRQFREVTELVFKTRIGKKLSFQVSMTGFNALRSTRSPFHIETHPRLLEVVQLTKFSQDDSQAIFESKMTGRSLVNGIQVRDLELLCGTTYLPYVLIRKYLWRQAVNTGGVWKGLRQPGLLHGDVLFGLPFMYKGSTRGSKQRVTMPWKPMMSVLMMQELEQGKEINKLARRDIEATRWHTKPSIEQGIRIALSSGIVRFMRYKTCIQTAVINLLARWERHEHYLYMYRPISDNERDETGTDIWFDEWLYAVTGKQV